MAAAATGYISAALWKGQGAGSAAGGRWLTHPALAVAVALAVETGLGYADDAGLPDAVLLTVHLVAAARRRCWRCGSGCITCCCTKDSVPGKGGPGVPELRAGRSGHAVLPGLRGNRAG